MCIRDRRNSLWVSHVKSMVPPFDIAYTNNPLVIELLCEAGIEVKQSPLFKRNKYSGTQIRRLMLKGGKWEKFVPESVIEIINEINGVKRLRNVTHSERFIHCSGTHSIEHPVHGEKISSINSNL